MVSIRTLKASGVFKAEKPEWNWKGILPEPPDVELGYVWPGMEDPGIRLRNPSVWLPLEEWHPRFGGVSWWLLCPRCGRRCQALYMPPGAVEWYFPMRCRECWGLTYWSRQNAHFYDRGTCGAITALLALRYGCTMRELVASLNRDRKRETWEMD